MEGRYEPLLQHAGDPFRCSQLPISQSFPSRIWSSNPLLQVVNREPFLRLLGTCISIVAAGGVLQLLPVLQPLLAEVGLFGHSCLGDGIPCSTQEEFLSSVHHAGRGVTCISVLLQGLWYDFRGPARAGAEGASMVVIGQLLLAMALVAVPSYDSILCWLAFPAFFLVEFGAMLSMWSAAGLCQSWPNHQGVVIGSAVTAWQTSRSGSYVFASASSLLASLGFLSGTSLGLVILAFSAVPVMAAIAICKLIPGKVKHLSQEDTMRSLENLQSVVQVSAVVVSTQSVAPLAAAVPTNSTDFRHVHDIDELAQKTYSSAALTQCIEGVERETTNETHHALPCHATAWTNVHRGSTMLFQRSATEEKDTTKICETSLKPVSSILAEVEEKKLPPLLSNPVNRSETPVTKRKSIEERDLFKSSTENSARSRGQNHNYDGFMWPARSPGVQLGHGRKQPLWRPCATSGIAIDGHVDEVDTVIAADEQIKLPSKTSDTHFAAPSLRDGHEELDGFDSSGQPMLKDTNILDIGTKVCEESLSQVEPLVLPPSSSHGAEIPFPSPIMLFPKHSIAQSEVDDGEKTFLSARSVDADLGDVSEYFHSKGSPRIQLHLGNVEPPSRERLGGGSKEIPVGANGVASETHKIPWPGSAWPPAAQEKGRPLLHTLPKKFVGTSI